MSSPIIQRAVYNLLRQFPYYGGLIHSFLLREDEGVKTASVDFHAAGDCIALSLNPAYFSSISDFERQALLIHLCTHVDRLHLVRMADFPDERRAHIAADMAVNGYVPGLPAGAVYATQYGLPEFQTLAYYYERIEPKEQSAATTKPDDEGEKKTVTKKVQVAQPTTDSHDWAGGSRLSRDQKIDLVEKTIARAVEKAFRGAGQMPDHVKESLRQLRQMRTKDWQTMLRMFVGRTLEGSDPEPTWGRPHRRYGIQQPGNRLGEGKRLAVAFDTSTSMSMAELLRAFAETRVIVRQDVEGFLLLFDTKVNHVEPLREMPEVIIRNRGGTDFRDLMEKADKLGCDGLVIFTDGDDASVCAPPATPVLWVYTDGMRDKYNWGFKTVLDRNDT